MNRTIMRLVIVTEIFTLFCLMLMPAVIHMLSDLWGKALYALLVITSIGLAIALRYALAGVAGAEFCGGWSLDLRARFVHRGLGAAIHWARVRAERAGVLPRLALPSGGHALVVGQDARPGVN